MSFRNRSLLFIALIFSTQSALFAGGERQNDSFHNETRQRDYEAVQEFINSKRTIPLAEKMPDFLIYGDVRSETFYKSEKDQRGDQLRSPRWASDIAMNLRTKYKCGRTNAKTRIQYRNTNGIFSDLICKEGSANKKNASDGLLGSGNCEGIAVKEALFGWIAWQRGEDDDQILLLQAGRTNLYNMFDSRVQFASNADGLFQKYSHVFKPDWQAYVQFGEFVVDERSNHYAWLVEGGLVDAFESKWDFKYSYIDWRHRGRNRCKTSNAQGTRFQISQFTTAFNILKAEDCCLNKKARFYGAFLVNHAADRILATNFSLANTAWYFGMIVGDVKKEGDWSFDINYQYVQAQAVPDADENGIGRGNFNRDNFYDNSGNNEGNTNFKGYHMEVLYAITDQFFLDITFDHSVALNSNIGLGSHQYSKLEIDFIVKF